MSNSPYHLTQFSAGLRMKALCRDGVIRQATAGKSCRSVLCDFQGCVVSPVSVQLTIAGKRRTVTGYLEIEAGQVCFHANRRLSNHALIPATKHKPFRSLLSRRMLALMYAHNYRHGISWGVVSDYADALGCWCRDWAKGEDSTRTGWQVRRELRRLSPATLSELSAYLFRFARFKYAAGE